MATEGQTRRTILQGLQQARSRLQKLQEDRSPSPLNSILPVAPPTIPPPQVQTDPTLFNKQQKLAIQKAQSQSQGYYVSEPSPHGNVLIPVLPRFDESGKLIPMT